MLHVWTLRIYLHWTSHKNKIILNNYFLVTLFLIFEIVYYKKILHRKKDIIFLIKILHLSTITIFANRSVLTSSIPEECHCPTDSRNQFRIVSIHRSPIRNLVLFSPRLKRMRNGERKEEPNRLKRDEDKFSFPRKR